MAGADLLGMDRDGPAESDSHTGYGIDRLQASFHLSGSPAGDPLRAKGPEELLAKSHLVCSLRCFRSPGCVAADYPGGIEPENGFSPQDNRFSWNKLSDRAWRNNQRFRHKPQYFVGNPANRRVAPAGRCRAAQLTTRQSIGCVYRFPLTCASLATRGQRQTIDAGRLPPPSLPASAWPAKSGDVVS